MIGRNKLRRHLTYLSRTFSVCKAEQLLARLYEGNRFEECLARLLAGDIPTLQYLVKQLPKLEAIMKQQHQPSLAALLAYKDTYRIPDGE